MVRRQLLFCIEFKYLWNVTKLKHEKKKGSVRQVSWFPQAVCSQR